MLKSKWILFFISSVISFLVTSNAYEASKVGISKERLNKIAPVLEENIQAGRFPGFITAVARKGEVVHYETQGFSDVEKKIPLEKDSIFRIYSMSKPVTGVALMILLEEGVRFD